MAKDPAFLFYSGDFLVGTNTMNFEDRGKYITILSQMHQQGRISEETISFMVGLISVKLKSKFDVDEDGLWYNKRLEIETEKRNNFTESRRLNGLKGGRGKGNKPKGKAKAKYMDNHMEDGNDNINGIINDNKTDFEKTFYDFLIMRKAIKKPATQRAIELIKIELNKLSLNENTQIEILQQSIRNSWQGVFPLKEKTEKTDKLNEFKNQFHRI